MNQEFRRAIEKWLETATPEQLNVARDLTRDVLIATRDPDVRQDAVDALAALEDEIAFREALRDHKADLAICELTRYVRAGLGYSDDE
jgi:hypothetical protein